MVVVRCILIVDCPCDLATSGRSSSPKPGRAADARGLSTGADENKNALLRPQATSATQNYACGCHHARCWDGDDDVGLMARLDGGQLTRRAPSVDRGNTATSWKLCVVQPSGRLSWLARIRLRFNPVLRRLTVLVA